MNLKDFVDNFDIAKPNWSVAPTDFPKGYQIGQTRIRDKFRKNP